jgi:hypothetical protein
MKVSPIGVLAAIVIVGVTVEVVEQKSRQAAYALVVLLLLGIITFNSRAFSIEFARIMYVLNAPTRSSRNPTSPTSTPFPQANVPSTQPGMKPGANSTAATPTPFR